MLAATLRGLVDDSLAVTLKTGRIYCSKLEHALCIRHLIVLENRGYLKVEETGRATRPTTNAQNQCHLQRIKLQMAGCHPNLICHCAIVEKEAGLEQTDPYLRSITMSKHVKRFSNVCSATLVQGGFSKRTEGEVHPPYRFR